jgi:hypothetical protein
MSWSKLEFRVTEIAEFRRVSMHYVESVTVTEYKGDETIRTLLKVDE